MTDSQNWRAVYVEDNVKILDQVREYLEGEDFDFGTLTVHGVSDFQDAKKQLEQRKVDLLILDVIHGDTFTGERRGRDVLSDWQKAGFAPVLFYTALPDSVRDLESAFTAVVAKDDGLAVLRDQICKIFALRIPQIHRALSSHFDGVLCNYMWGFMTDHMEELSGLLEKPDFFRLLARRLALEFTQNMKPSLEGLYPDANISEPGDAMIHPVEYYVKPAIGTDLQLGDICKLEWQDEQRLFVVVWPSCDLVHRGGKGYRVERALCAHTQRLRESREYVKWSKKRSKTSEGELQRLMGNNRSSGQSERYHFLPGAWDIPSMIVDFGELEHIPLETLTSAERLATVASPFAESMAARLVRYLGRLGTPDLDLQLMLEHIEQEK